MNNMINNNIDNKQTEIEKFVKFKLKYLILQTIYTINYEYIRYADIFALRYGLFDNNSLSLDDVALKYNLSRERIRQIIAKTFRKIYAKFKKDKWGMLLNEYLGDINRVFLQNSNNYELNLDYIKDFLNNEFGNDDFLLFELTNRLMRENYSIKKNTKPKIEITDSEIRLSIYNCVKDFSEKYGKTGITSILKGSGLRENKYNESAFSSVHYGKLKGVNSLKIIEQIENLIRQEVLVNEKIGTYSLIVLKINSSKDFLF